MLSDIFVGLKSSSEFKLIKMNITKLLKQRDREDLIPVWDEFLDKFPDAAEDPNVPFDDVYGDILKQHAGTARYVPVYVLLMIFITIYFIPQKFA